MKTNLLKIKLMAVVSSLVVLTALPASAIAEGRWANNHPRRAEVNGRLANQNHRIQQERREGEISGGQAARLHQQDRQIRQEERLMARQDGGHITRQEQRTLNQQENHVSREIGR